MSSFLSFLGQLGLIVALVGPVLLLHRFLEPTLDTPRGDTVAKIAAIVGGVLLLVATVAAALGANHVCGGCFMFTIFYAWPCTAYQNRPATPPIPALS